MQVRDAEKTEIETLAQIWYDGWRDAHAEILPEELKRARTLESFKERLAAGISSVRAVGPVGAPLGFTYVKGDELYQLYVSAEARGKGATVHRRVTVLEWGEADGRPIASKVEIANPASERSTIFVRRDVEYDRGIPPRTFSLRVLS